MRLRSRCRCRSEFEANQSLNTVRPRDTTALEQAWLDAQVYRDQLQVRVLLSLLTRNCSMTRVTNILCDERTTYDGWGQIQAQHLTTLARNASSLIVPVDLRHASPRVTADPEQQEQQQQQSLGAGGHDRKKLIRAIRARTRSVSGQVLVQSRRNRFMQGPEPSWLVNRGDSEGEGNQERARADGHHESQSHGRGCGCEHGHEHDHEHGHHLSEEVAVPAVVLRRRRQNTA